MAFSPGFLHHDPLSLVGLLGVDWVALTTPLPGVLRDTRCRNCWLSCLFTVSPGCVLTTPIGLAGKNYSLHTLLTHTATQPEVWQQVARSA